LLALTSALTCQEKISEEATAFFQTWPLFSDNCFPRFKRNFPSPFAKPRKGKPCLVSDTTAPPVLEKTTAEKESSSKKKAAKKKAAKKVAKRVAKKAKGQVPVVNEQLDCPVWPETDYLEADGGGDNGVGYDDTNNSNTNTNLEQSENNSINNSINNNSTNNNSITTTNQLPFLAGTLNQILQQQSKSNSVS
jgi:hypothetical protein